MNDPYPPPTPPTRRSRAKAPWILGVTMAFVLGIIIGAVGGATTAGDATSVDPRPTPRDTIGAGPDSETTMSEPPAAPPPAAPDPDVEYSHTCDYVLGDFSENVETGYRFIADAVLDNVGNVGATVKLKAIWYLGGGDEITKSRTVKVKYDETGERVGFTVPATQDQIDRHQSLEGTTCEVKATITDTFGDAH